MIIYKIVNNINGKTYIGLTKKALSQRIANHIKSNKSYVQKALNKYGLDSFTVTVIDYAEDAQVIKEKEKYWIDKLNCKWPNGYNLTDGGDGLVGATEVTLKKMRESHIGQVCWNKGGVGWNKGLTKENNSSMASASAKKKGRPAHNKGKPNPGASLANKGKVSPYKGRKSSEETKAKQRLAAKNRPPQSEETKRKRSKSLEGRICSESTRMLIRDKAIGRKPTPQHIANLKIASRKRHDNEKLLKAAAAGNC